MLFTHARNKKYQDDFNKMKPSAFAEMTYDGRPIPVWLQEPAFDSQLEENNKEKFPKWLQEPVNFS